MHVQKQIDELLALRASEWFELLPTASAEQLRAFEAWLCESRLHVQEFLEIAEVEFCLHHLDPTRRQDIDALLNRVAPNIAALPKRPAAGPFRTRGRLRRRKVVGVAAACASIAFAALFAYERINPPNQYITAIGEQRIVELTDSSMITLNADSQIAVRLRDSERQIELLRGAAIFKVAHDPTRPFRVLTRAGAIQAVGTQFNVHNRVNGDTRVTVLEGRVRLTTQHGGGKTAQTLQLTLDAGEEADIELVGKIVRREHPVVSNAVAWRERRLVFENAELPEMVAEFNRHNPTLRLRLDGIQNDGRRYDGAFEATDPEALAKLLSREPDLAVERREGAIVIRKR